MSQDGPGYENSYNVETSLRRGIDKREALLRTAVAAMQHNGIDLPQPLAEWFRETVQEDLEVVARDLTRKAGVIFCRNEDFTRSGGVLSEEAKREQVEAFRLANLARVAAGWSECKEWRRGR